MPCSLQCMPQIHAHPCMPCPHACRNSMRLHRMQPPMLQTPCASMHALQPPCMPCILQCMPQLHTRRHSMHAPPRLLQVNERHACGCSLHACATSSIHALQTPCMRLYALHPPMHAANPCMRRHGCHRSTSTHVVPLKHVIYQNLCFTLFTMSTLLGQRAPCGRCSHGHDRSAGAGSFWSMSFALGSLPCGVLCLGVLCIGVTVCWTPLVAFVCVLADVCVCVCVRERVRERERAMRPRPRSVSWRRFVWSMSVGGL
jgi:hypothetical protein